MNWWLLALFFSGIPSLVHADVSDILLKFHPYLTVQEEYNNNILLSTNPNKLNDYITSTFAGLNVYDLKPGNYGINLDLSGGYNYYAKNSELSYWSALGRLDTWYSVSPHLTFRLRDYLVRSDAARENVYYGQLQYDAQGNYTGNTLPPQQYLSTIHGVQAIYFRNVVEPSLEYRFGRENMFSVLYRNNIYENQNPLYEDSMENTLNPRLVYWFDIRNGISLDYTLTLNTYQTSPDQLTNRVVPRYTYRFDPRTSVFGDFRFEYQDFQSPGVDYFVYNPSLGLQYNFSPTLYGLFQGGWWWQVPKQGSTSSGPFFSLSLNQRLEKTFYSLSLQGGYTEDYVTAQNLGFNKTYGGYGVIHHRLTPSLDLGLSGYMTRNIFTSSNEKTWQWSIRGGPSYLLFRWLAVSLEAAYIGNNSNIPTNDYNQFLAMFRVTLAQPGFQPGLMGRETYRSTGPTGPSY